MMGRRQFPRYQTRFQWISWRVLGSKPNCNRPVILTIWRFSQLDLVEIRLAIHNRFLARFVGFRLDMTSFSQIRLQSKTRPCSSKDPSELTWLFDWSATSLQIVHPTWSGRSRVGKKPNPWSPLITTQKSSVIWLPCKGISPSTYTKLLLIVPICKGACQYAREHSKFL